MHHADTCATTDAIGMAEINLKINLNYQINQDQLFAL